MAKCKYCKKELGNKNIVTVDIDKSVVWSNDKEIIFESRNGRRFYCHQKCFQDRTKERLFKQGDKA